MGEARAGTRNVYVYPEKQTSIERLSARIASAIGPYIDEDIDDEKFEDLSLEIKAIGRRFIKENREEEKS